MKKIPFNVPPHFGGELKNISKALANDKLCGDGPFGKKCETWFEKRFNCKRALLTTSCTHALEMAAILIDIKHGDEVIMPSFTFVSTANAFVLRGAKIVFVDIKKDTMNLDETQIEAAISEKTKAIVPVHYGGVGCEMTKIMKIAEKYNLYVIEDAAQAMMAKYKNNHLGTFGHLSAFSFHETKNYSSGGEGGLLVINDAKFKERAEIIREKGTNRSQFFRGMVDKYSWVDIGSSYLMSELQSAYLWNQIQNAESMNAARIEAWNYYHRQLSAMHRKGFIEIFQCPKNCKHNAHIFFIKVKNLDLRIELMEFLDKKNIQTAFHYIPLHSSENGLANGRFSGTDAHTTRESEKLIRLPIWHGITKDEQDHVISSIKDFFKQFK